MTHSGEQWKPVNEYRGLYEVSNMGRVRSLDRTVTDSNGRGRRYKGMVLRTPPNRGGYPFVCLYSQGERQARTVHSLVAEAFIGPRPEGMEVCHGDGDPANNHVENLRYGTSRENNLDMVKHGTHYQAVKTRCPRGHELSAENILPSVAKLGHRTCLACHRARAHVYRHPELKPQFKAVADSYYQTILEERKTAA